MKLTGATGNNLKNVSIELPLGKLICVTEFLEVVSRP
jgi:excinuclease ABC subunit A